MSTLIRAGLLEINLVDHIVKRGDEEIKLTATEFKLLAYLAAHAGRVLTHQAILSHVWDPADVDHVEYLRVYMRQLRKKLEDDPDQPQFLITEPGVGYRLLADDMHYQKPSAVFVQNLSHNGRMRRRRRLSYWPSTAKLPHFGAFLFVLYATGLNFCRRFILP